MLTLIQDVQWWISAIALPLISGMFWLFWREHTNTQTTFKTLQSLIELRSSQLRESLSAFQLEVAKIYAQSSDLKELEGRLTSHLLRIEAKLDTTALKTEALKAHNNRRNP